MFKLPDINYKYDVMKWKALNDEKQLQCFCGTAFKKNSPGADVMTCKDCGFSVSLKAICSCLTSKAFLNWPLLQVPICRDCSRVGIRMYGKEKMALTFSCSCPKGETNYFRTNDGHATCWEGFINIDRANDLTIDNGDENKPGKKIFARQDMF